MARADVHSTLSSLAICLLVFMHVCVRCVYRARYVGVSVCQWDGVSVCQWDGVLVCWCVGVSVWLCVGETVLRDLGVHVCAIET